jgi:hypothetical protein
MNGIFNISDTTSGWIEELTNEASSMESLLLLVISYQIIIVLKRFIKIVTMFRKALLLRTCQWS